MIDQLKTQLATGKTIKININVVPKSQSNKIMTCEFDHQSNQYTLKVKVRGIPEKGQVNENLIDFLSKELSLSKSTIKIISGFASRQKIITIHAL